MHASIRRLTHMRLAIPVLCLVATLAAGCVHKIGHPAGQRGDPEQLEVKVA
jgi:hypothetical protein